MVEGGGGRSRLGEGGGCGWRGIGGDSGELEGGRTECVSGVLRRYQGTKVRSSRRDEEVGEMVIGRSGEVARVTLLPPERTIRMAKKGQRRGIVRTEEPQSHRLG
jgi:hypothetical protein